MNVLSLFDGMSCGQLALERAGVPIDTYYASEIDKYAVAVTMANFPSTVQLGNVLRWREWRINWASIDLLIGGSPCQGFSFAGKQLAFDDPRSALFFVYVDILNHIRSVSPKVKFLLENVKMKKEYLDVISSYLGVWPERINSALVSAQNRVRYYWANWTFGQPEDLGVVLANIIGGAIKEKAKTPRVGGRPPPPGSKQEWDGVYIDQTPRGKNAGGLKALDGKTPTLSASAWQNNNELIFLGGLEKGRRLDDGQSLSRNYREGARIYDIAGKSATLTSQSKGGEGGYSGLYGVKSGARRDRGDEIRKDDKANALLTTGHQSRWLAEEGVLYRKLTPVECERLQTVPDNYTNHVSNTQRYKMLGNGWTVDVVAHIFRAMGRKVPGGFICN